MGKIRIFSTGANRNSDDGKLDYEGFLSPLTLERYAEYMHEHRKLSDGSLRDSDNWQKGIPLTAYMKSGFRHFIQWWKLHRWIQPFNNWHQQSDKESKEIEDALCALIFNASGYLHEIIKNKNSKR